MVIINTAMLCDLRPRNLKNKEKQKYKDWNKTQENAMEDNSNKKGKEI